MATFRDLIEYNEKVKAVANHLYEKLVEAGTVNEDDDIESWQAYLFCRKKAVEFINENNQTAT